MDPQHQHVQQLQLWPVVADADMQRQLSNNQPDMAMQQPYMQPDMQLQPLQVLQSLQPLQQSLLQPDASGMRMQPNDVDTEPSSPSRRKKRRLLEDRRFGEGPQYHS